MTHEQLARFFHDTYERLAPSFGYETRPETREFDPESANGKLMLAVCSAVLAHLAQRGTSPEGWKLVPVVPTVQMLEAARKKFFSVRESLGAFWAESAIYRELLAASPQAQPMPDGVSGARGETFSPADADGKTQEAPLQAKGKP